MEKNSRMYPRMEVRLPVHYKYFENGSVYHALKGEVENVSAQGMAMLNDRPIECGQKLLVTLFLPPENARTDSRRCLNTTEENGLPVVILSQAAWCRSHGGEDYTVGVQFLVPDSHHRERFLKFLDDFQIYRPIQYEAMPANDENEP